MFKITEEEGQARTGILKTSHGKVETPSFKAVATKGAVKFVTTDELKETGAQAIISNAFILYLRPGLNIIEESGGLHKFMGWDRTIFTDCGGFQVFSLEGDFHIRTIDEGIAFKSPFDGSKHLLTPKKTIEIQLRLGSDVAMALDHMPLAGCTKAQAIESLKHTHKWMQECKKIHDKENNSKQLLFGIAQGSIFPDLRLKSIRFIDSLDFDGIAFGGLAIGEPKEKMYEMIRISSANCSAEKPRYVMGVGSPMDILKCVALGVDTFDSVFPTRNARHGQLFTRKGPINIENSAFRKDFSPVDEHCKCFSCKKHTRAYIHHLFKTSEPLGKILASYHNLFFIQQMLRDVRKAIKGNEFNYFKNTFIEDYKGVNHKGRK
ncbi:tRNA guanosine(34) transglycosylase Tgt [Candidatus Woesearchaeota archaeon]|nr:MAG: tRNA guanosine(34) transglycosylase Tgt [Candidatus Woesearchaeota archaeon]